MTAVPAIIAHDALCGVRYNLWLFQNPKQYQYLRDYIAKCRDCMGTYRKAIPLSEVIKGRRENLR